MRKVKKGWYKMSAVGTALSVMLMLAPTAALADDYTEEVDQALNSTLSAINLHGVEAMDLETALMAVQSQRVQLLDQQLRSQIEEVNRRQEEIAKWNEQLQQLDPNSPEAIELRGQIDTLNNTAQLDMLRLQSISNKRNEAFDTMTDFIKKMQDSRASIIGNMR